MNTHGKSEIITFKTDSSLARKLDTMPNKSEFIRNAILSALDSCCPLCGGTGILSPNQMKHWQDFAESHELKKCRGCREYHLICHESK